MKLALLLPLSGVSAAVTKVNLFTSKNAAGSTDACVDDADFKDEAGMSCADWATEIAGGAPKCADQKEYSTFGLNQLMCNCPVACGGTDCRADTCLSECVGWSQAGTYGLRDSGSDGKSSWLDQFFPNYCAASLAIGEPCVYASQCSSGFCCPNMRMCMADASTSVSSDAWSPNGLKVWKAAATGGTQPCAKAPASCKSVGSTGKPHSTFDVSLKDCGCAQGINQRIWANKWSECATGGTDFCIYHGQSWSTVTATIKANLFLPGATKAGDLDEHVKAVFQEYAMWALAKDHATYALATNVNIAFADVSGAATDLVETAVTITIDLQTQSANAAALKTAVTSADFKTNFDTRICSAGTKCMDASASRFGWYCNASMIQTPSSQGKALGWWKSTNTAVGMKYAMELSQQKAACSGVAITAATTAGASGGGAAGDSSSGAAAQGVFGAALVALFAAVM